MKKTLFLFLILINLTPLHSVSADWTSRFVVYSNDIYEITDEPILPSVIDQKIGHVTRYSDEEGTYRGNFSNTFPKGTAYYSIQDKDPKEVIAIETIQDTYLKAINKGHYDNDEIETQYRIWAIVTIGALIFVIIFIIMKVRRKKDV
ncbi:hypothetical protein [Paenibacillus monticola]|uniref:hypothetical protein n=1 Tax=Paenibacillus monticola TaxID=2666075 RepID=UPI0018A0413E|nr:hypothetical protein [Paenibacillus monticola]